MLDLAPDGCDEIERNNEGIEVSLGNWDRDGDWIPLAYHIINYQLMIQRSESETMMFLITIVVEFSHSR